MAIAQALLPEFDHEAAVTRTVLERVPEARADWRPHPKSMSLGQLAIHIATIPGWGIATLRGTELDLAPPDGPPYKAAAWVSLATTLATFDDQIAKARAALVATTDVEMAQPWTLKKGGAKIFTMPRAGVLRAFVLSHAVHHRAQLGVYLRLLDVPVPAMYGPTADTQG
jgi:uncharacterized damage-inducible protein DinB